MNILQEFNYITLDESQKLISVFGVSITNLNKQYKFVINKNADMINYKLRLFDLVC